MKILHVFDFFSPHGGGTVELLYKLTRAQAQRGHEVTIYTSDFKLDRDYIASLPEVKIYPFHCVSSVGLFYVTPSLVEAAREHLKDFDVIHLHCVRSYQNIVIHSWAKKYGVPYVLDQHGSLPRTHDKRGFKWLLRWLFDVTFGYRILKDASRVIGETEVGVTEFKSFGIKQDQVVLISPPFPVEGFAQLPPFGHFRDKYNLRDKKIVMFLGRINWIKGIDFLINGFYQLTKLRSDAILVIVGNDDGFKSTLENQIKQLHLSDKVLFTGFLGGQDKLSALVDADVVIQTSRYEQGAWAPFEAVLCDTPIIVSSNSGAGEDVKKIDAGYLVEYGNENELRDMIQYIFNNTAEAKTKTKKAKEYIKANLSMAKGVEKYEALYQEVMKMKRGKK